jgi:CheY-like chemotaxis protein
MNRRILAVEDNPDNMNLFQWILEDEGYEFTGVASAEEGLELLENHVFDLVVMDISLPGMDGKEATRRLRNDPRFRDLPIVAATAHAIKEEESAIRDSGVSALVTKPLDEQLFLDTIDSLLTEVI